MAEKRYYWLKLEEGFFRQKEIKKLRKLAGGDTYTIIYLKMLLRSLENNGVLYYEGVEPTFAEEIALDIEEDEENVSVVLNFLQSRGILVEKSPDEILLVTCAEMTGSETGSARRMRNKRSREAIEAEEIPALPCPERNNVTEECNNVQKCDSDVRKRYTEKEIEKEKEKELDKEKDTDKRERIDYQMIINMYNETCVSLPSVKALNDNRKKAIKARLHTYSIEDFETLFMKAEASDFLKGRNNRNWSATFDWLIKDANMAKVLEGNFDNKPDYRNYKKPEQQEDTRRNSEDIDLTGIYC